MDLLRLVYEKILLKTDLNLRGDYSVFSNGTTLVETLLHRLLHHSNIVKISCQSYRLKGKSTAGIVPTNTASRAMLVRLENRLSG